ncbi:solute carrier family 15 member 2-like [Babylonia areolata]|uniref:solute carrier family 15 member 2-like n=1 Tax=Babylonia areolata TaxID=304850 RepID=UPI003FD4BBD9
MNLSLFSNHPDYPSSIYFILGSEFCERFTYFGLRTILVLYLTNWLRLSRNEATAVYHLFSCVAYFSPIIGAIMADSYVGRYKTILYIGTIYAIGCIILSVTSFPPPELIGPFFGLLLISLGTGGIKPCVVTFGGDQFERNQVKEKANFFSTFYFVINIGSLLSTVITPMLRSDVHCVENSCYPLAFGVPAILMTLALIVFYAGSPQYKFTPPTGSLITKAIRCMVQNFIRDVQLLSRLVWLFLPLPMFWALFNQQGSRWTLQAAQLDGRFAFLGRLKPEQMQALNPLLIVLLIPVFERVIYPCMKSCDISHRPLQRMVTGMLFSSLAFVCAALLQMKIDNTVEKPVESGMAGYTIFNTMNCKLVVQGTPAPFYQGNVPPFGQTSYWTVEAGTKAISVYCPTTGLQAAVNADLQSEQAYRLVVTEQQGKMKILVLDEKREKSTNGTASISFLHLLAWVNSAAVKVMSTRDEVEAVVIKLNVSNATSFHVFEPGSYQLYFPTFAATAQQNAPTSGWTDVGKPFEVGSGGIYTVALIDPSNSYDFADVVVESYVDVKENSLSMMLMVPQYVAITIAEILFSISGLAFAYTQSPETMKSIIQACWLLTTSVGDLIVVFVAEIKVVSDQVSEFWLFAGLMFADTIIFSVMTCFFSYVKHKQLKKPKPPPKQMPKPKKKRRPKKKGKGGKRQKRRPRKKSDEDEGNSRSSSSKSRRSSNDKADKGEKGDSKKDNAKT